MHSNADVIVRCMLFRSRDMINGLIGLESEQYVKSVARGNNMVKSSSNYWISGRTIPTKGTHESVKQLQRFPQIKITMWNENKNKNKFLDYSQSNRQHVCRKQIITLVTIKHLFDFQTIHKHTHTQSKNTTQPKTFVLNWLDMNIADFTSHNNCTAVSFLGCDNRNRNQDQWFSPDFSLSLSLSLKLFVFPFVSLSLARSLAHSFSLRLNIIIFTTLH